ncbi:hypothetical protein FB451DRAFT_1172521 [Mycena latifolia]|nr:hypothetical protein FB451DRAFT_1172521 [Mycena latifolia]
MLSIYPAHVKALESSDSASRNGIQLHTLDYPVCQDWNDAPALEDTLANRTSSHSVILSLVNVKGSCDKRSSRTRKIKWPEDRTVSRAYQPRSQANLLDSMEDLQAIDVLFIILTTRVPRIQSNVHSRLSMLKHFPDLCGHIRKLQVAVRPEYHLAWPKADESRHNTGSGVWWPSLPGIFRAWWPLNGATRDGWGCPDLRLVFCAVGCSPIDPGRLLFQYKNLIPFFLTVRVGPGGGQIPINKVPALFTRESPSMLSFTGACHRVPNIPFPERLRALDVVLSPINAEEIATFVAHLLRFAPQTPSLTPKKFSGHPRSH